MQNRRESAPDERTCRRSDKDTRVNRLVPPTCGQPNGKVYRNEYRRVSGYPISARVPAYFLYIQVIEPGKTRYPASEGCGESNMKKLILTGAVLLAMLPAAAAAHVLIRPGFGMSYGWYRPAYGWYAPYWGPAYPYYWGPYAAPNAGQVKLDTKVKDAEVLINGRYAGTVHELKTMTLRAGDYSIDVRAPGRVPFHEDIHVVAGKTIKLHPGLEVEGPVVGS